MRPALFAVTLLVTAPVAAQTSPLSPAVTTPVLASVNAEIAPSAGLGWDAPRDLDVTHSTAWVQLDTWFSEEGMDLLAAALGRDAIVPTVSFAR